MANHEHGHGHGGHGHGGHGGHSAEDDALLAEMLDLDAEVLHAYLTEVMDGLWERAGDRTDRIVDLGSGTGTGTVALAARFPGATVTAVDRSAAMLQRVGDKARAHGFTDRLRTVPADLDAGLPAVGPVDLVWASASLHHVADADRVLAELFAAIRPGGLLVAAELSGFPYFLGDDPLEQRCHAVLRQGLSHDVPLLGTDWGPRLRRAGFAVEPEQVYDIALSPPLPPAAGRYAQLSLSRLRSGLGDRLPADDRAALDTLLAGAGLAARTDLAVRTTRTVWVGRRP